MTTIIHVRVDNTGYDSATSQICSWAHCGESRYICAANVHVVMEAHGSADVREAVNAADLVAPDGMPLVWMMRAKGQRGQKRVYGPTLMLSVLEVAAQQKIPVGFYGGASDVLNRLIERIEAKYANLPVAYAYSPPFRELTTEEDKALIEQINQSGAKILFVGLGCPKQEIWMARHRGKVRAVMLGVGAAFDFHAGAKSQAPVWMQNSGLEWLFRLVTEPRRLWKRYLYHNPRFIVLALADLFGLLKERS